MKTLLLAISALTLSATTALCQMKEGHILYTIEMSSDNPDMAMAINMMQGSTVNVYFTEEASRSEMKMGSFMTNTTIVDHKTEKSIMLMSGMMGNKAIRTDKIETDGEEDLEDFEIELVDESKEVAGYTCKKAILTTEEGNELIYWYTEEIAFQKNQKNNIDLPGLPLQFQLLENEMMMTMTASQVNKKFKKTEGMFSTEVPEGYTETTLEELQSGMGY